VGKGEEVTERLGTDCCHVPFQIRTSRMTKSATGRTVFSTGLFLYAAGLVVAFVGGPGVYWPSTGADCAFDWFFFPWVYVHLHDMSSFWTDAPIEHASIAISGWVNPLFLLAVFSIVVGKTQQLTKVLRIVILIFLPFSWVVFVTRHIYPREGYFLWSIGMLLTLFSVELGLQGSPLVFRVSHRL